MSYKITQTNGNILTNVPDTQIVNTYGGLSLIGKGYDGFGTALNNDLVRMTENFANSVPPTNPFIGQIWFDTIGNVIKFWNGSIFKPISVITPSDTAPVNPIEGDEWFDSINLQLYVWNGTTWTLIGPPSVQTSGLNGIIASPTTVTNNGNVVYLEVYANSSLMGIISSVAFSDPTIDGFSAIRPGFNFVTSPISGVPVSSMYNLQTLTIGNSDQFTLSVDANNNSIIQSNAIEVLIANNSNAVSSTLAGNVSGTVYVNNLHANSLTGNAPGANKQILYNNQGVIDASPMITVDSIGLTVNVSNSLNANSIFCTNSITANANINANVGGVFGNVTVNSNISIGNNISIHGSTTIGGTIIGTGPASITVVPAAAAPYALVIDNSSSSSICTISQTGNIITNGNLNVKGISTINFGNATTQVSLPTNAPPQFGAPLMAGLAHQSLWGNANVAQWANNSFGTNGLQVLPSGLIIQWGFVAGSVGPTYITPFNSPNINFPNNCFGVWLTSNNTIGGNTMLPEVTYLDQTGFHWQRGTSSPTDGQNNVFWFAIGN